MKPKKVLFCSEASYLSTGYAVYSREIISRLHKMGYDMIEFATYGNLRDPRCNVPWKFVGIFPENEQEAQIYNSNPANQFGGYKFEETCLKHQIDVCAVINDPWIDKYKVESPYRRIYSLLMMSTVDSEPQPQEWIYDFEQADKFFTYTKWGEQECRKRSSLIKYGGQTSPGADYNIFKPLPNKLKHKNMFGLNKFVIGTVMRNQKRKLFPDLIRSYDMLIDQNPSMANSTALYLHTAWPDNGWNIPELVKGSKYPKNIYLTYNCQQCGVVYPDNYKEAVTTCKRCGNYSAILPNSDKGISTQSLSTIYNLFDVFVQYANQEGFGIPMVEAAGCGVPVFGVDYSAMESVVRDLGGYTIKVKEKVLEPDKRTFLAVPDNQDLVDKLKKFYYLPEFEKNRKSIESREKAIKNYNYDKAAEVWAKAIDEMPYADWTVQPDIRQLPPQPPQMPTYQLVEWAIVNILGKPELVGSYYHTKLVKDINMQLRISQPGVPHQKFGPNEMLNELAGIRMNINQWEERRVSTIRS